MQYSLLLLACMEQGREAPGVDEEQADSDAYSDFDNDDNNADGMGRGIDPRADQGGKKVKGPSLLFPEVVDMATTMGIQLVAQCPATGLYVMEATQEATGNAVPSKQTGLIQPSFTKGWHCGLEFVCRSCWQLQEKCHARDTSEQPRPRLARQRLYRAIRA